MTSASNFDYAPFDRLLSADGPVMLAGQQLMRVAAIGADGIVFPPSYANPSEKKDDPPVYNIDVIDNRIATADACVNVCVLDSIPSQANRIEPLFKSPAYAALVPQYEVRFLDDSPPVSILEIGHRIADAAFRGTTLRPKIVEAFRAYARSNAVPLARIGPTSLVFGAWDSRGTGVKIPRLVNSIVRAFNVVQLKRSAQYTPPIKYEQEGLIPTGLDGKPSDHGLADVPSTHKIGGVQIHGDIRRDFSLNLSALRALRGLTDDESLKLQRYVLGLSLVALTATLDPNFRQGCCLLPKGAPTWRQFSATGEDSEWTPKELPIASFAAAAASNFGVQPVAEQPLLFSKETLGESIATDTQKKADRKSKSGGTPRERLQKLVAALKSKGTTLTAAPVKKLKDFLAKQGGDSELGPVSRQIVTILDGTENAAEKVRAIQALCPRDSSPAADDDSSEASDNDQGGQG